MTSQKRFFQHTHGQRILQQAREKVCGTERKSWRSEREKMSEPRDRVGGRWGFGEHAQCSEDATSVVQFNLLDQNKRCSL